MSVFSAVARWASGPRADEETQIADAIQELEDAVEIHKRYHERLIRRIRIDHQHSERALKTAEMALRIAKKNGLSE